LTGTETERKLKFEVYWEVLGLLPPHRVIDACSRAAKGEIGSKGFLPSVGEIYQAAFKSAVRGYPLLPQLPEPDISGDEREKITNEFKDLVAGLRAIPRGSSPPKIRDWTRSSGPLDSQAKGWPKKLGLQTEPKRVEPEK